MGVKYSKPRLRRNRRCSSMRKRQAPEGSNDPVPPPKEKWECGNNNKFSELDDGCKFCGVPEKQHSISSKSAGVPKFCDDDMKSGSRSVKKGYIENFDINKDLIVDLPDRSRSGYSSSWDSREKSKSLPVKSTLHDPNRVLMGKDEEQEWTITLYEIDKMSGRVPREDMARLVSSICEAVDAKVGESPQCRKTVRVRLSVSPERSSHARMQKTANHPYRDRTGCRCVNCPNTEPSSRRYSNEARSRLRRSDTSSPVRASNATRRGYHHSRHMRDHSLEYADRRKHYPKLEGLENNIHLLDAEKDNFPRTSNRSDRSKSLPQCKNRTSVKRDDQPYHLSKSKTPSSTKHCQRHHGNESRNAIHRSRRKDPRFASPYDQHFQEAMYLRLRELQRQGAFEKRRATHNESDEADDDSDCDASVNQLCERTEKSNASDYTQCLPNDVTGLAKPTKGHAIENEPPCRELVPVTSNNTEHASTLTSVHHHHYHYHHGIISPDSESTDKRAEECVVNAVNNAFPSVNLSTDVNLEAANRQSSQHHHHHHYYRYDKET